MSTLCTVVVQNPSRDAFLSPRVYDDLIVIRRRAALGSLPTVELRLRHRHERISLVRTPRRPF